MLHYILVFLSYILFFIIACDDKHRVKAEYNLSTPIIIGAIHIFLLTFLYEKLLVSILLNKVHSHEVISYSRQSEAAYIPYCFLQVCFFSAI